MYINKLIIYNWGNENESDERWERLRVADQLKPMYRKEMEEKGLH